MKQVVDSAWRGPIPEFHHVQPNRCIRSGWSMIGAFSCSDDASSRAPSWDNRFDRESLLFVIRNNEGLDALRSLWYVASPGSSQNQSWVLKTRRKQSHFGRWILFFTIVGSRWSRACAWSILSRAHFLSLHPSESPNRGTGPCGWFQTMAIIDIVWGWFLVASSTVHEKLLYVIMISSSFGTLY